MAHLTVGPADHGHELQVAAGDHVVVQLPENATTGHLWSPEELPDQVALVHDSREAGSRPGEGGMRRLEFEVLGSSGGTIKLRRGRPWEGDSGVVERWEVRLAAAGEGG